MGWERGRELERGMGNGMGEGMRHNGDDRGESWGLWGWGCALPTLCCIQPVQFYTLFSKIIHNRSHQTWPASAGRAAKGWATIYNGRAMLKLEGGATAEKGI